MSFLWGSSQWGSAFILALKVGNTQQALTLEKEGGILVHFANFPNPQTSSCPIIYEQPDNLLHHGLPAIKCHTLK
jgi:hypothetical protein